MSMTNGASPTSGLATVRYEAGFIVLSYVISLVGCMSALELLHRRTSIRGLFNWYLLIASSVAMGGIGIWSMHFVGMRAVVLGDGQTDMQISYNQGFTALSFFLPIGVLLPAFYVLAISGKASQIQILLAGLLTGTAICAMHYVGQVGIANYNCTYNTGNIVGAAVIAVVASLVALSIFFRLRDTWTDSWWKRALCAALLAASVSGMHWTAAVGTEYHHRPDDGKGGSQSRVQTVIFCAVLSFASCVVLLSIAFLKRRRSIVHRRRAQELVLACAYFDENDRVMVSNDGFLPYQKITNQFVRKTFGEDELNRSHPAFMWVYEATRNWTTLRELVPGMQSQLDADPVARKYQPGHGQSVDFTRGGSTDFTVIFKQLFCVAAERLATQLHEPMEQLGTLFEEPLETGTTKLNKVLQDQLTGPNLHDPEKDAVPKMFGKGRYLFLNRRLMKNEAADFAALGYRFASINHVAESLARNMQVNHESMSSRLERMRICTSIERMHPAGVHLACFLLRPNIHSGFDILVPTKNQNQLPLITLPIKEVTKSHMELFRSIDEWTVREILTELITEESNQNQESNFRWQVYSAFVRLIDTVKDAETMMNARFSARSVQAPCRNLVGDDSTSTSTCTLFSIRYLGTIHSSYSQKELIYVPLGFFSAQQVVETSQSRHQTFKRNVHLEFQNCLDSSRKRRFSEADSEGMKKLERFVSRASTKQAQRHSQGFFSKMGFNTPKTSRQNSQSVTHSPGRTSGRSTAEPETADTTPVSKKNMNSSMEEILQLKTIDISSATSKKDDEITPVKQSDEIELESLPDGREAFVSELFALFRMSQIVKKTKSRDGE